MLKKIIFGIVAVSFILGSTGMALAEMSGMDHQQMTSTTPPAVIKKAENVGNVICPVTGDRITEKYKTTVEYKGKTYNLCCSDCAGKFKKEPAKYIKKVEAKNTKSKTK